MYHTCFCIVHPHSFRSRSSNDQSKLMVTICKFDMLRLFDEDETPPKRQHKFTHPFHSVLIKLGLRSLLGSCRTNSSRMRPANSSSRPLSAGIPSVRLDLRPTNPLRMKRPRLPNQQKLGSNALAMLSAVSSYSVYSLAARGVPGHQMSRCAKVRH